VNIYQLYRTDHVGYDQYASFVVVAESVEAAHALVEAAHPPSDWGFNEWVPREYVKVRLVGWAISAITEPEILVEDCREG
jgi:hypothetical protein